MTPPKSSSLTLPARTELPLLAQRAGVVLLGSLLIAACAHVAVPLPWTPVPMTMQPFAVLLLALLLGPGLGAATATAYLLEGAAGLPVLVPGFGGLLPLGPSAGYLLSYPAVGALVGLLAPRAAGFWRKAGAAAAGSALILLGGASWLAVATHGSFGHIWMVAVLPFLAGDVLKAGLAAGLAARFHRAHSRTAL